jgi:hypothetical protein
MQINSITRPKIQCFFLKIKSHCGTILPGNARLSSRKFEASKNFTTGQSPPLKSDTLFCSKEIASEISDELEISEEEDADDD